MFQKIRLRLTILSGAITTLILVIMTLGYLYISEKNLISNKLISYQNDIYTITSNLEQQAVISHTWLSQIEGNGSYYIALLDNNVPFLFNNKKHDNHYTLLIDNVWNYYRQYPHDLKIYTISYRSHYVGFLYESTKMNEKARQEYYCYVITVEKGDAILELLLIIPFSQIKEQLLSQRILFLCIILVALISIWLFAWFFTGKLLYPIEENRKKQTQFVAAASHELRTPLAVILSCAEASFEKMVTNNSEQLFERDLSAIKSEALRMSTLLEDLLTLSSQDAGHFTVLKTSVELDTLVLDVCEAFESMAHAKKIQLSVLLTDTALPLCCCDKERIYQVVAILLHNAVSYTPFGGQIEVSLTVQNNFFFLSVSDTGDGIPDIEKNKIFDRFYRSEKARSTKGHFGLGLSIAYEIVMAHHGTIKVHDHTGGGTIFVVQLPIK